MQHQDPDLPNVIRLQREPALNHDQIVLIIGLAFAGLLLLGWFLGWSG